MSIQIEYIDIKDQVRRVYYIRTCLRWNNVKVITTVVALLITPINYNFPEWHDRRNRFYYILFFINMINNWNLIAVDAYIICSQLL